MTREWLVRKGAHFAIDVEGAGPPLVFLHAGVCDRRSWQGSVEAFRPKWRTIAYDRRGFGETTADPDTAFSHLDDLGAILKRFARQPAVLVGCSRGGGLAIDYALQSPDKVKAIVVIGTALSGQPQPTSWPKNLTEFIKRYEAAEKAGDPATLNKIECHAWLDGPLAPEGRVAGKARDLFFDMNSRALAQACKQEKKPPSAFERLAQIKLPMLAICGRLDFPDVAAACRSVAERVPGARLEWMEGAAHLPMLECPDRLNALIAPFLEKHRGT